MLGSNSLNRPKKPNEHKPVNYEQWYPSLIVMQRFVFQTIHEANQIAQEISVRCASSIRVETGLNEIFINAIEHGNLGISFTEKQNIIKDDNWLVKVNKETQKNQNKDKKVTVDFEKTLDYIKVRTKDCGEGFDWQNQCKPHHHQYNGRGITIAKHYTFDDVFYNTKGNETTCYLYL